MVASQTVGTLTVPLLLGQIAAIESAYRGNTLLEGLRAAGVDIWSIETLRDAEVLQAVLDDEELAARLQQALDHARDYSVPIPPRAASLPSWPEVVLAHFRRGEIPTYANLPPVRLWRSVRELAGESPVYQHSEVEAASFWTQALERHGMARRVGPVDHNRTSDQILHWLRVRKILPSRPLRDLSPWSLGFEELPHDFPHPPTVPVLPGDLIIFHEPLFAGAAVLTGVTAEGRPSEVLFLMGGDLCLGHPEVPGEFPSYHRPKRRRPDYLIVPRSPYDDPTVRRVLDLDELLEVEEAVRFDGPEFRTSDKGSGAGVSNEWIVYHEFRRSEFAILHLTIERGEKGRRLAVVIDFYSDRKEPEEARARLVLFNAAVEEMLTRVAGSLGFVRLNLFYKMIMPLSVLREGGEVLGRLGYQGSNSGGWGRLPGKKINLQSTRR